MKFFGKGSGMKHRYTAVIFCALLLCLPAAGRAFDVAALPSTVKVLPGGEYGQASAIELQAAKNEAVAFQIRLYSDTALTGVDAVIGELAGNDGVIPADAATGYREYYIEVTNDSSGALTDHPRDLGFYPDPLIPFSDPYADTPRPVGVPFDLEAGGIATLWIEWHVPETAAAGGYSGQVTITASGETKTVDVELLVYDFTLPATRNIATSFGFSTNKVKNYHGGPDGEQADKLPVIEQRYHQALHEHRIDRTHVRGDVSFAFDDQGVLQPVDWTAYDAFLAPYLEGTLYDDGVPVNRFDITLFRPGSGTGSLTEDQYRQAARALAEHLQAKGWWDKAYVYSTDEPWLNGGQETWDRIKKDIDLQLEASELWRDKALITGSYQEMVEDEVGIWCPVTPMYEDWFYTGGSMAGREEYARLKAMGKELWFYVCNANLPPYAGYDIDTSIGFEPRMVKWGAFYEGATGFLYWRVNYWVQDDPWNVLLNIEQFGETFSRNGDGFIFYPGDHNGEAGGKGSPAWLSIDGPIVSYRMKQIRDGLEDWELFIMADDLGAGDYVRSQIGRVYTRFGDFAWEDCASEGLFCPERPPWSLDGDMLIDARNNVALKIQYLLHPETYADPETAPDGDDDTAAEDEAAEGMEETTKTGAGSDDGGCNGGPGPAAIVLLAAAMALRRRVVLPQS